MATQDIDTLGPIWTLSLRGVLTFVASRLDINGCVLRYLEGTAIYTDRQAVYSLIYIVAKCHFFSEFHSFLHMKRYTKIFMECEGVYSLL